MRKALLSIVCIASAAASAMAQAFVSSPAALQETSTNVVITYRGDQPDTKGATPFKGTTTDLYAHIGVYTTKSPTSWAYASNWGTNTDKYKLAYKSSNTWQLSIGDLRSYFGITDSSEKITKICIIARNAAASTQTADCFIDVLEEGYQMLMSSSLTNTAITATTTATFTVAVTQPSAITLTVNGANVKTVSSAQELEAAYTFSAVGEYVVKATATAGGKTISKSITVLYSNASTQQNYPGGVPKMGAQRASNGDVTFCIAAPQKSTAIIVPSWDGYATLNKNVMKYQDYNGYRYFWTTVSGLDPDKQYPYYYLIDGTAVGDPYANLILDPYSDKWLRSDIWPDMPKYPYDIITNDAMLAVYHANQDNYNWVVKDFKVPSVKSMTIYEICLRDFTGSDMTDDGTIRKAIDKLPYLKELGINCIELMPVMEFNGNNSWGYNNNFYMALDKSYGSPDDLKEFIDKSHQMGIAVILDIVFNQSDGLHPWYMLYPANASHPFYNVPDAPHKYSVLNDWKQEHPLVRQQWTDAITYWMTKYKVDGFRFDLTKGLADSKDYTSGGANTDSYIQSRVDNLKRFTDVIKSIKADAIHINEHLGDLSEENAFYANGQLSWNNQNYNSSRYAAGQITNADLQYFSSSKCSRTAGALVSYAESHDEERVGYYQKTQGYLKSKTHEDRMKRLGSMAAWLLLVPDATPMIWQFGELGADESITAGGDRTNPKTVLWSYLNDEDRKALHDNYRDLILLRRNNPQLFEDSNAQYSNNFSSSSNGRWIRYRNGDSDLIAFINPSYTSSASIQVTGLAANASTYQLITASKGFSGKMAGSTNMTPLSIPANSFAVFATPSVSSIDDVSADGESTDALAVKVIDGNITVDGLTSGFSVYDTAGRAVSPVAPAAGIYIVTSGARSAKVSVN